MSTSYNTYQITVDTLPDTKSSQGKGTPKTYQLELQVVDSSMCAPAFTVFEWGLDGDKHYSRLTRETRILNCNEIVSRIWNSRGFKEFQEAERGVIITEFYKLLIDMFDAYEEKKENLKEEHL